MQDIWRNGEVVANWKDAEVVPMLKKEIYRAVITGVASACSTWWVNCLPKLSIMQMILCWNHSVVFRR